MGLNIKIARIRKGLTQKQLAEQIGASRISITGLESGKFLNPTLRTLKKIAKALDVSISELLDGE